MAYLDCEFLLVRSGKSYRVSHANLLSVSQDDDELLVIRSDSTSYRVKKQNWEKIADSDKLLVNQAGKSYWVKGALVNQPQLPEFRITNFNAPTQYDSYVIAGAFSYENKYGDGEPTATYTWYVDGIEMSGSPIYYLSSYDYNKSCYCKLTLVEPSSNHPTSPRTATKDSSSITLAAPAITISQLGSISPNPPKSLEYVSTTESSYTGGISGESVSWSYRWETEGGSFLSSSREFNVSGSNIGDRIKCRVTVTANSGGSDSQWTPLSSSVSQHTVYFSKTGNISVPSNFWVGATLGHGAMTVEGGVSPYSWEYQWVRDDSRVVGTSTTYTVTTSDVGRRIRRRTTCSDKYGVSTTYTSDYSPVVDYGPAYVSSWGRWGSTAYNVNTTATWNQTQVSGGDGTRNRTDTYREYAITNQFCVENRPGTWGTPESDLSDSKLRRMVIARDADTELWQIRKGRSRRLRWHFGNSSTGKSVYSKKNGQDSALYYTERPWMICHKFEITSTQFDYPFVFGVRDITNGITTIFRDDLYVGTFKFYCVHSLQNKTSYDCSFELHDTGNATAHYYGSFPCTWADWTHGNSHNSTAWPALSFNWMNGWYGTAEPDSSTGVYKKTSSSAWNEKIPEGIYYVTAEESIDVNGYHQSTNPIKYPTSGNPWHTGIAHGSGDNHAPAAQLEYYRLGRILSARGTPMTEEDTSIVVPGLGSDVGDFNVSPND